MEPVLFILFIIYFIITIIEINQDERRFTKKYGKTKNNSNTATTKIQFK